MVRRTLLEGFPEIAGEADGWDPSSVSHASAQKLPWRCDLGHSYEAAVYSCTAGSGCPYCAERKLLEGFNDLVHLRPDLAALAHGWDPATLTLRSGLVRGWKCEIGHIYEMRVADKTDPNKAQGCLICSGKRVLAGYNDLAFLDPVIAAQAHKWDPTFLTASSNKKVEWICSLDHVWIASVTRPPN